MQYYVRELDDRRAVLIAEDGYPLSTFDNVDEAVATCITDCRVAPLWIEWYADTSVQTRSNERFPQTLCRYFRLPRLTPLSHFAGAC